MEAEEQGLAAEVHYVEVEVQGLEAEVHCVEVEVQGFEAKVSQEEVELDDLVWKYLSNDFGVSYSETSCLLLPIYHSRS